MKKLLIFIFAFAMILSNGANAQYDSTNLPGLSTSNLKPNNSSTGSGVPDPNQRDVATTYTETMVEPCPGGYYPNSAVPTDGTNVASQNVNGGVIYDQTVTTNRFGTTTYSGWQQVNFLCTEIPPAPTCASNQTTVSNPYWDSTTNTWQGLQCQDPVLQATDPMAACPASLPGYTGSYSWLTNSDATQMAKVYAQAYGVSGYSSAYRSTYIYGAQYETSCATSTQYQALCYVNANNALNSILYVKTGNNTGGGGNCHH
ncbi:hypothetical protein [Paraburkholderia tropica]|uniref:hypothetical protein n=1 Tax=Paraburkholderia tropica TaxID=92647 RepID=UPI003D2C8544